MSLPDLRPESLIVSGSAQANQLAYFEFMAKGKWRDPLRAFGVGPKQQRH